MEHRLCHLPRRRAMMTPSSFKRVIASALEITQQITRKGSLFFSERREERDPFSLAARAGSHQSLLTPASYSLLTPGLRDGRRLQVPHLKGDHDGSCGRAGRAQLRARAYLDLAPDSFDVSDDRHVRALMPRPRLLDLILLVCFFQGRLSPRGPLWCQTTR